MEGKSNSAHHMGDLIVSPSPSPLQQQNFAGGSSHSPASSLDITKVVKLPPAITIEGMITQHVIKVPEESEEDQQEQIPAGHLKKKGFRKRKKSLHNNGGSDGNYIPPYKLRRMYLRRQSSCPGGLSKTTLRFLLGGNAHDPLNLNGLGDSDNAVTPKTSPMPVSAHNFTEIPIMIPKNYQDPLRLADDDVENTRDVIIGILTDSKRSQKRKRNRKRSLRKRNESGCSIDSVASESEGNAEADAAAVIAENNIRELQDDEEFIIERGEVNQIGEDSVCSIKSPPADDDDSRATLQNEEQTHHEKDLAQQIENKTSPLSYQNHVEEEKSEVRTTDPEPFPFRVSSDYIPLSSHYQPSPFVIDTMNENFTVLPFESPSMSNYMGTQDTFTITEPFSPPPRPRNLDVIIEHRVPSGHYGLGWTPPRNEIQRRELPQQPPATQQAMFNRRHRHLLDPIVSPVFPNFGSGKRSWTTGSHHGHPRHKKQQSQQHQESKSEVKKNERDGTSKQGIKLSKKFRPKDKIFQYGNYNQYYGYRNQGHEEDARLRAFKKEWIEGKDVLDIGCNIGHVTLCIARDYDPRRIVGIDIDAYLIKVANKNIKHYVDRDPNDVSIKFPQSLSVIHGSLQPPQLEAVGRTPEYTGTLSQGERKRIPFPYNVCFRHENYVLDVDELLETIKPQYDVILCLSTTKWIHLNFGDDGLKRFFRRAFLNLRPGGLFILEPQPWTSYMKKKNLTEQIFQNFQNIKFFPKQFESFLLQDVGYTSMKLIGIPAHHSKGFQRPIYVFMKGITKPTATPTSTITSTEQQDILEPRKDDSKAAELIVTFTQEI